MATINDILNSGSPATETIAKLKEKSTSVPTWGGPRGLRKQYDSTRHPVMDKSLYPDRTDSDGKLEKVTRITCDYMRLAAKRMTELVCGIPVKRIYNPEENNDNQQQIATYIENILQRNRIDSVNIERCHLLFAGCEVMTLWYAVEQPTQAYGFDSKLKFRCRNFSPMYGDELYPLFDEYGDLIALSVGYSRKTGGNTVSYFDTFTADRHIKWSNEKGWDIVEDEDFSVGKIPGVYMFRPTPIWENLDNIVYEIEWAMSRNGNYLRKNSKPIFVVYANEEIPVEQAPDDPMKTDRDILQYPAGSQAGYITWNQAVENLKFYVNELRQSFFTQLQLPDWSYEKMSQQALSGESRKQLFIDSQLKVKDESGRLLEFFDREVNVIKAFLKTVLPENMHKDIDALKVETEITPFTITDEKDTIENIMTATGGKPILSQREGVRMLGWSDDIEKTMEELKAQETGNLFEQFE